MTLTLTDLFCGAGGSSSGAEQVPGVQVIIAANHWKQAVETHARNHPNTAHDIADISQVDPRRYPATDMLWASPSCTNHSQARGHRRDADRQPDLFGEILPDEAAERSRATMWDVPRFVEAMKLRGRPYKGFVVENVVEVRDWMFYDAWVSALRTAGYCLHFVYLNSAYAGAGGLPAPQSRDRWYCVGHLAAIACPDLRKWTRPDAYCSSCDQTVTAIQAWKRPERQYGRHGAQYSWRCPTAACRGAEVHPAVLPAAFAINWDLPGDRIGDRKRALAPKTVARIQAGLDRYAQPLLVPAGGTWREDAKPLSEPMSTRTTRETDGIAIPPLIVPVEGREGVNARTVFSPYRTQTARLQDALVVPLRNNNTAKAAHSAPLDTIAAAGNHHALVTRPGFVMRNNTGGGEMCTPFDEPLRTLTTAGHQSLITWRHLLVVQYNRTGQARPLDEPLGTLTTRDRFGLVSLDELAELANVAVEDCLFRMLEPDEIKAGMAFPANYVVLGNRREQVRQCGNAVTPPAARDLVAALVEVITGEDVTFPGAA